MALWLFLHLLFLVSFSLSLYLCDVGFGNNKWLDVFRCHVKPGEGHVLSEHTITTGEGGVSGSKVWVWGAHSRGNRLQRDGRCARLTSPVESYLKLCFLFNWPWLVPCPEPEC